MEKLGLAAVCGVGMVVAYIAGLADLLVAGMIGRAVL
jgi:hypothetical protein